jgi:hypothetical protein
MTNIRTIEIDTLGGIQTHVIIDNEDGSQTSMSKAVWDELQAKEGNHN